MDIKAYIESGIIESYVLGMADDQERAELEQYSRQYPEIRAAIDAFELSLEQNAMANAIQPAAHVKANILAEIAGEFSDITDTGTTGKVVSMSTPGIGWLRYVAAASVILLVVSAATNVYFYRQFREASSQYQALLIEKSSLLAQNQTLQAKGLDLYQGIK